MSYLPVREGFARFVRIVEAALSWVAFAGACARLTDPYLRRKANDAVRFTASTTSVTTPSPFGALAVPSKLTGTAVTQRTLAGLLERGAAFGTALLLQPSSEAVAVTYQGKVLGYVQSKHVPWVRLLIPHGLTVHLLQVTGRSAPGRPLGANIAFGHVAEAVATALARGIRRRSR